MDVITTIDDAIKSFFKKETMKADVISKCILVVMVVESNAQDNVCSETPLVPEHCCQNEDSLTSCMELCTRLMLTSSCHSACQCLSVFSGYEETECMVLCGEVKQLIHGS